METIQNWNLDGWRIECKKLLFELDTNSTDENIAYVDMDHYREYYKDGLTPQEANDAAYENAIENE